MTDYRFEREARTAYSEIYTIWDGDRSAGRVDVHFTPASVYATLCVSEGAEEEAIQEMIGAVDDELVMTADPYREDLVVTVWSGKEAGVYSDEDLGEETLDELDEESEGNGARP
ncbi:MAG: hypothetical protein GEU28_01400 [Dehalococcoidia bacterium]|nr:hypothetical protein [Dehalococcoidia bacterium]